MSTWKYNRMYAARYNRTPVEKVTDPLIPSKIDALLAKPDLNAWEKNFLSSIKESFTKYNGLTKGQHDAFLNVEKKHDATATAARDEWRKSWDAEKKAAWDILIEYYSKTPYYRGAVDKVKANPAYIPSEKEYAAICKNKYAVKFLEYRKIPAKYAVGELVIYKWYGDYKLATVIKIGEVESAAKGSRVYTINVIGASDLSVVEEKELLYYRESMHSKILKPGAKNVPF